jgi:flagellar protein FlaG
VSEISITRFQPALATKGKVSSVEAVENDLDANTSQNPLTGKEQGDSSSGKEQQPGKKSASRGKVSSGTDAGEPSHPVQSEIDNKILEQAVSRLNEYVQTVKRDLIFDIDPLGHEPCVTVVDRESRKVLRQFDSKEALEMVRRLESEEPISLFKTQV